MEVCHFTWRPYKKCHFSLKKWVWHNFELKIPVWGVQICLKKMNMLFLVTGINFNVLEIGVDHLTISKISPFSSGQYSFVWFYHVPKHVVYNCRFICESFYGTSMSELPLGVTSFISETFPWVLEVFLTCQKCIIRSRIIRDRILRSRILRSGILYMFIDVFICFYMFLWK